MKRKPGGRRISIGVRLIIGGYTIITNMEKRGCELILMLKI
jgi:hypothetical protein